MRSALRVLPPLVLLCTSACGSAPPPAPPRRAPVRAAEPASSPVSDGEWDGACEGPAAERAQRFRRLAIRDARSRHDAAAVAALNAWGPPEPVVAEARVAVAEVVRQMVRHCGHDEALALTSRLVAFQTVHAIGAPASQPAFRELAAFLSSWSERAGLAFAISGEHDAYEVVLRGAPGAGARSLLLVAHGDVVPVNDPPAVSPPDETPAGWSFPPFRAVVREGRLLGRGTEDDKGPIAAALVAMAGLREAGLLPTGDVALAIGTGEEDDWSGMRRYAESATPAEHVISIDAEFPVVGAEHGFVAWGLQLPMAPPRRAGRRPLAVDVRGGLFLTQIPGEARLELTPGAGTLDALLERARRAAEEELTARRAAAPAGPWRIEVAIEQRSGRPATDRAVVITVHGVAVHSSVAEEGHNALWPLASLARRLDVAPGAIRSMLDVVTELFDGDHHGERLGLDYSDALMGRLLVAPTVLKIEGGRLVLEVNMRRPRGRTADEFRAALGQALERVRQRHAGVTQVAEVYVGEPHVADTSGPLVSTLLGIWRDATGEEGAVRTSRGGTYARLFPGAVNFGPSFPGTPYRGHAPDEFITLEALGRTTDLYLEALLRLAVLPAPTSAPR